MGETPVGPTGKMPVLQLPVLPIEAGDFAFGLAIGGAFFQIGALIVRHFSRRDADL
jgi:hypothetical protein